MTLTKPETQLSRGLVSRQAANAALRGALAIHGGDEAHPEVRVARNRVNQVVAKQNAVGRPRVERERGIPI